MGRNCILFKGLVFKSAYHFHISNSPYQTIKNEYLQASFELAFLLLCKNTYLFGLFMQFFQGLLSWTRSDNLTCIDTTCNLLTLYDLNLGYRGVYLETTTSLKKLTCSRNSIQLNSLQLRWQQQQQHHQLFHPGKGSLLLHYLLLISHGSSTKYSHFGHGLFLKALHRVSLGTKKLSNEIELENKRRRKRDVLMMITIVIMLIENLPLIGRGNNSKQLAYCQSFPQNREAFQ